MNPENRNPEIETESKLGFKVGDTISVRRSNGEVENDWVVSDISHLEHDIRIFVEKKKPDGHRMIKGFSKTRDGELYQDLLDLNNK